MKDLNNITLICADSNFDRGYQTIKKNQKDFSFHSAKLFTSELHLLDDVITIEYPIHSKLEYSRFILKELYKYIYTEFVLIVQYDGYIINPDAWVDEFFKYDYIGAPWPDKVIGNGGFSLRSNRLLKYVKDLPYDNRPEDVFICRDNAQLLIEQGFNFAPLDMAYRFSIENENYQGSFGYHGGLKPRNYDLWRNSRG